MTEQVKKATTGLFLQSGRLSDHRMYVRHTNYTPLQPQKSSDPGKKSPKQPPAYTWEKRLPTWMCHYLWRRAMIGWVSVDTLAYKLETAEQTIEWGLVEAGIQALGLERRT